MDLLIFAGFKTLHCCLWTVNCCLFCQHWYRDLSLVLVANKLVKLVKTASSHEPSWMGWPGYRDQWISVNFALGSYENFQPGFWDEKRPKSWGRVPATESTMERIRCCEESIPAFIYPGNRAEVFMAKFLSPLAEIPVEKTEIWGTEPARPSQSASCEEALRFLLRN